jgi:N-acyl-D-amino-acid deacylase
MLDLILTGGILVDGKGGKGRPADVGVMGNRVVALGDLRGRGARLEIEVSGMVVAPGFVDIHAHSGLALLADSRAASKVRQGVTTEVSGQCGFSVAPLVGQARDELPAFLDRVGLEPDWETVIGYLEKLERQGIALNVGTLVGHGTLRYATMGGIDRPASPAERQAMVRLLAQGMEEGALGVSSGLFYAPGSYADLDELVALAQVAAAHGGLYASHIRDEAAGLEASIEEALAVGRAAAGPVQISHLKLASRDDWGQADRLLGSLDTAREGMDLGWDQYPYTAAATSLDAIVPTAFHAGGKETLLERLRTPAVRADIARSLASRAGRNWGQERDDWGWDRILLSYHPWQPDLAGRTLSDIAAERAAAPLDTALDLILESEAQATMVDFCMDEGDVAAILRHPHTAIATDAEALAADGPLAKGMPHPRAYGTYPRVLAHYVRKQGLVSLEEAIRKMTSLPASRLGLSDRGIVREGAFADLVVLDPQAIVDTATFSDPHRYPAGIQHVLVNGGFAVRDGRQTAGRFGRVLRRGG